MSILGSRVFSHCVASPLGYIHWWVRGSFRNTVAMLLQKLLGKNNQVGEEGDTTVGGNHVNFKFYSQSFKATFTVCEGKF